MQGILKSACLGVRGWLLRPFHVPIERPDLSRIRSILVFRCDRIGDMVQATPLLAALREEFPAARLSVVASEANAPVLEGDPRVDRILIKDSGGFGRVLERLGGEVVDLLVDPYWEYDMRWVWAARRVAARYRLGFDVQGRGLFYNVRVPGPFPGMSAAEQMLELCRRGLGRPFPSSDPRVFLSDAERELGLWFLRNHGVDTNLPLVFLHPGGYYPEQRWPCDRFVRVAQDLAGSGRCGVVIAGGPSDGLLMRNRTADRVRFLIVASLRDWIGLVSHARLLICNNSGPFHLARALGVRTLSLVGPSTDRALWVPRDPRHAVLEADRLDSIRVEAVLERATSILGEPRPVPARGVRPFGLAGDSGRAGEPSESESAPSRTGVGKTRRDWIIGVDVRELRVGTYTGIGRFVRTFLRYAATEMTRERLVLYGDVTTHVSLDGRILAFNMLSSTWPVVDQVELPSKLRQDKIDLFFSPYYKAPLFCPCPYVVTIHDLIYLHVNDGTWLQPVKNRALIQATRWIASRAAGVLTISEHSRQDIQRHLGIDMERVEVIQNSIAPFFKPVGERVKAAARARFGLAERFLIYVGNFLPHKNVDGLVEAYLSLPQALRNQYPLVLIGARDRHYERLRKRYAGALESGEIRIFSQVPNIDLTAIYSCATLCVVPSIYEGFGLPVLEAMACGTPVLASNRTALPSVVGDAGLLVEPTARDLGAGMLRLLGDPALRQALREKGLRRSQEYSYMKMGARIHAFLERCWTAARTRG